MVATTARRSGRPMAHSLLTCCCGQALEASHTRHCPRCGVRVDAARGRHRDKGHHVRDLMCPPGWPS
jgi:hypothetical protein